MQENNKKLVQALEFQQQGQADQAALLFKEVLATDPGNTIALFSLSLITLNAGNLAEAVRISDLGIKADPLYAPLRAVNGAALQAMNRKEEALQSYDKALEIDPNYTTALTNSGVLLKEMFRYKEAVERFNHILSFDPDNTSALSNCGTLLSLFKEREWAIGMFKRLVTIDPTYTNALGLLLHEQQHLCDWSNYQSLSSQIIEGIRAGRRACNSLALMSILDSAKDQQLAAQIFARHYCPKQAISYWQGVRYRHKKIRLAYVSPDFREHPVAHLMAGVFERHDKSRFETIAISLMPDDGSRLRARMRKTFDQFIDAHTMGANQIAKLMCEMKIDVAVDLSGYTSDSRTEIFAYRPVPVQVNYLGYPGTMGVDYMDYIIADRQVIPEDQQQYYDEKVVYLPDAYLPTDNSIKIAERTPTREECGLPAEGVVFCSFNHDYKISPHIFGVWMRLLQQVPGSILWLMSRSEPSRVNLCQAAKERGVDPSRLIFAGRVPLVEDHLARYRLADIFLDTHPYNAHTTAADALMAGLPVVTFMGDAFPARVAGSLLHAIGMPELIANSLEEYQQLALKLVTTPELLADIKARISANIATCPLFDTDTFTRNLEAAYMDMHHESRHKELPVHKPKAVTVTKSLDLGCGLRPKNPFNADQLFGVDVGDELPANIRAADLAVEPIPFDDNYFNFVSAHDFIGHIPRVLYAPRRRYAFVELMNEVYRVLKVDGLFLSLTPGYPHSPAFQDPANVNSINFETFPFYFDDVNRWAAKYGFKGAFKITFQEWRGSNLLTVMKKVVLSEAEKPASNIRQAEADPIAQVLELQRQGKIDEAVKVLWEEHSKDPTNGDPVYLLSQIALNHGNYAEALRISEHGVKYAPLYTHLWLIHGQALHALGRAEEALQGFNRALDINPDYVEALVNSGLVLKEMLRNQEALERFNHVLALHPGHAVAEKNRHLLLA